MGMFDKDKLFAPDGKMKDWAENDVPFILWAAEVKGEVDTPDGPSDKTPIVWLTVSSTNSPDTRNIVSMVGDNIKEKVDGQVEGDMPCLCVTKTVPSSIEGGNDAYVLNWYGDYEPAKGKK